jgi:hypothetical protein
VERFARAGLDLHSVRVQKTGATLEELNSTLSQPGFKLTAFSFGNLPFVVGKLRKLGLASHRDLYAHELAGAPAGNDEGTLA